jgi:hypothetical protein
MFDFEWQKMPKLERTQKMTLINDLGVPTMAPIGCSFTGVFDTVFDPVFSLFASYIPKYSHCFS